ncbi:hypothetical protein DPMN_169491 [Dreissena polymorpha]|uniref:Uncharacterized protein n=1 Tax=Dreissena polymorpha TaxID=45954 RepID=A0A9D4DUR9_DREPO|nr:hypothetical protein DPMN_169491 [Dreissena polymorpha]
MAVCVTVQAEDGGYFSPAYLVFLGSRTGKMSAKQALSDGYSRKKFAKLHVVADGELQMTRDDSGLLVLTDSVSPELEIFSGQVLENGSQLHGFTSSYTLCVVAFAQETVDSAHRERKSSPG